MHHCRSSVRGTPATEVVKHHERVNPPKDWYDLVCGPLTAFWQQRAIVQNADQYSFHTPAGIKVLNDLIFAIGTVKRRYNAFVSPVATGQA